MAREVQVTFDCGDPAALGEFWAAVLGYQPDPPPPGFDTWAAALEAWGVPEDQRNSAWAVHDPDGAGPRVFFQQVPEGKSVKNRLHLDVRVATELRGDERMAALEAEADRLEALGATRAYRVEPAPPMELGFITMHDPEDNEFCLD